MQQICTASRDLTCDSRSLTTTIYGVTTLGASCGALAGLRWVACLHEHVRQVPMCGSCAAEQDQLCRACLESREPHHCPLFIDGHLRARASAEVQ
jgi:hypothetical protein